MEAALGYTIAAFFSDYKARLEYGGIEVVNCSLPGRAF